jgi:hypothetical protein
MIHTRPDNQKLPRFSKHEHQSSETTATKFQSATFTIQPIESLITVAADSAAVVVEVEVAYRGEEEQRQEQNHLVEVACRDEEVVRASQVVAEQVVLSSSGSVEAAAFPSASAQTVAEVGTPEAASLQIAVVEVRHVAYPVVPDPGRVHQDQVAFAQEVE